ncbi:MAG: hypothetical protein GEV08_09885 [Acidimicrobiia bacterium]|nr:hypothetical protein [Acidimicrobiia bacterium]
MPAAPAPPTSPAPVEPAPQLRPWRSAPWRRALYGSLALPAGIATFVLSLVGAAGLAGRLQRRLVSSLLLPGAAPADRPAGRWRANAMLSIPLGVLPCLLGTYLVANSARNLLYPLFSDGSYEHSWGGPTLPGAWAVHALGWGLTVVVIGLPLMWALTWPLHRVARRLGDLRV